MTEELDYWLEPDLIIALRHDIENKAAEIARLEKILRELESVRAGLKPRVIPAGAPTLDVYAVDSSHGSPPLELVGGVFTVIAYGYVGLTAGIQDRFVTGELYFSDVRESDVSRRSSILEKKMASRLLSAKIRGKKKMDLLILDGEIAIHPLPFNLATKGGKYEEVNRVVERMLHLAEKSGVSLVGITKRVRSKFLSAAVGRCLPVNDKVAASALLRPGEYITLGKLRELLPRWAWTHYADCEAGAEREKVIDCVRRGGGGAKGKTQLLCKRLLEFGQNFERVLNSAEYPALRLLGDVEIIYYMPPGHKTAVRAEILDTGGIGVEKIIAYLSATASSITGYPQLLDAVDQYVRVTPELVEAVLTALLSKTPQSLSTLLWPTNLQKRLTGRF